MVERAQIFYSIYRDVEEIVVEGRYESKDQVGAGGVTQLANELEASEFTVKVVAVKVVIHHVPCGSNTTKHLSAFLIQSATHLAPRSSSSLAFARRFTHPPPSKDDHRRMGPTCAIHLRTPPRPARTVRRAIPVCDDWEDNNVAAAAEPEDNQRIWDTAPHIADPKPESMPTLILSPSSSHAAPAPPQPPSSSSRRCEMLKEREARYQEVREPIFGKEASAAATAAAGAEMRNPHGLQKQSPSAEAAASKRLPRIPTPSIPCALSSSVLVRVPLPLLVTHTAHLSRVVPLPSHLSLHWRYFRSLCILPTSASLVLPFLATYLIYFPRPPFPRWDVCAAAPVYLPRRYTFSSFIHQVCSPHAPDALMPLLDSALAQFGVGIGCAFLLPSLFSIFFSPRYARCAVWAQAVWSAKSCVRWRAHLVGAGEVETSLRIAAGGIGVRAGRALTGTGGRLGESMSARDAAGIGLQQSGRRARRARTGVTRTGRRRELRAVGGVGGVSGGLEDACVAESWQAWDGEPVACEAPERLASSQRRGGVPAGPRACGRLYAVLSCGVSVRTRGTCGRTWRVLTMVGAMVSGGGAD
ncbi:hypothetical protein B0H17DRAFT_1332217 [Mycena rosella]|uniref:SUZ domain-containing protein n=1 Tax=Mycena rosella TaxID=1033263 RepID=A0AAD7DC07_MYCRO|nr:hypothetical protein B0H17DRAFT_1332217 [Mycena rosella]